MTLDQPDAHKPADALLEVRHATLAAVKQTKRLDHCRAYFATGADGDAVALVPGLFDDRLQCFGHFYSFSPASQLATSSISWST